MTLMEINVNERANVCKLNSYQETGLKKSVLVLLYFKHFSRKKGYVHDSLMISVDDSKEILPEFKRCMNILQRQQVELKWYMTSNNKPTFEKDIKHGRKTA